MRLINHEENFIISPCIAWFGGGGRKGPSESEKRAAQQQQEQMQRAAEEQRRQQEQQMEMQRQQMEAQRLQQEEMLRQMEANRPAPAAQAMTQSADADMASQASKRKGLRKSILAGESGQSSTTGYSTLG